MRWAALSLLCLAAASCGDVRGQPDNGYEGWPVYGGGPEQLRYSRLDQINTHNVSGLEVAWAYDTGDEFPGSQIQCNPLVVDGLLYGSSPNGRVFALDAATGEELWSRRLVVDGVPFEGRTLNRGFMHWRDGNDSRLYASARHLLYALDARTGDPVEGFGNGGAIDLRENLQPRAMNLAVSLRTPGVVYGNMLVIGSVVSESLPSAPGYIRAYECTDWSAALEIPHDPASGRAGL